VIVGEEGVVVSSPGGEKRLSLSTSRMERRKKKDQSNLLKLHPKDTPSQKKKGKSDGEKGRLPTRGKRQALLLLKNGFANKKAEQYCASFTTTGHTTEENTGKKVKEKSTRSPTKKDRFLTEKA